MSIESVVAEAGRLSLEERIKLVQTIWDDIAAEAHGWRPTPAQLVELRRRLAEHEASPGSAVPWDDMRRRLATLRKPP